jgi:hypothetical protein
MTDPQMIVRFTGVIKVNGSRDPFGSASAEASVVTPLLMMKGPMKVICIAAVGSATAGPRGPMVG